MLYNSKMFLASVYKDFEPTCPPLSLIFVIFLSRVQVSTPYPAILQLRYTLTLPVLRVFHCEH